MKAVTGTKMTTIKWQGQNSRNSHTNQAMKVATGTKVAQ